MMSIAARANVAKLVFCSDWQLSEMCKANPLDFVEKLFQKCVLTDSCKYSYFKSLDHDRVEPQLQVRYLLRLVSVRVSEDESVWEKFMTLLASMGERQMYDYLNNLTCSNTEGSQTSGSGSCLDTPLSSGDIPWILEVLVKASHNWQLIAIALGLCSHEIEDRHKRSNKLSLYSVLTCWLARDTSSPPGVTMNTLLTALRSEVVGEGRVAQELENKYRQSKQSSGICNLASFNSGLSVIGQSYNVEVADGKSTLLQVQASPRESVCYQWKKDGQPLANSCTYSGVDEDILVVSHASQGTEGEYTCCVSYRGREKYSNKITLTVLYPPAKKRLLDLYSVRKEVPPDLWPPVGAKSFVNLKVLQFPDKLIDYNDSIIAKDTEENFDKRIKVDYSEFFSEYKSGTLIVIEGHPGSGKTTLVHKIVTDWSSGNSLRKSKLVFLMTLRTISHNAPQETLSGLLRSFYHNEEELRKVCEEIEAASGEGVCFIIDGLDEYHPRDRDNSLIYQLLDKTFLPLAMIIVMTRPVAIDCLKIEAVSHRLEVVGFERNHILEYIDSFPFASLSCDSQVATTYPAKLKEYLYSHPNVFNMCYLPVHAAMICFLFKYQQGNIPTTQTKIYELFICSMILRHLRRHNAKAQVHSLKKLGGSTKDHFAKLCHLAYKMTISKKQVATPEVVGGELCELVSESDEYGMGLITISPITQFFGIATTYSFLHLTIQEFLTAHYLITSADIKQIKELVSHSMIPSSVWIFYCGLADFHNRVEVSKLNVIFKNYAICKFQCAYESQQKVVSEIVEKIFKGYYFLYSKKPSDLDALSYVLLNSSSPVKRLVLWNKNNDCSYFLQSMNNKDLSSLKTMLVDTRLNNTEVLALSDFLKSCGYLEKARFSFCEISQASAKSISNSFQSLEHLQDLQITLSCSSDGIITLLSQLAHLRITKLCLCFYKMESSYVFDIFQDLQLLTGGVLLYLQLKQCSIGSAAVIALANGLYHYNKSFDCRAHGDIVLNNRLCLVKLQKLELSHNRIGCAVVATLSTLLQHLTQLCSLDLSYNNIGPRGARTLANILHHLTELTEFYLSHNYIDLSSAIAILAASKDAPKLWTIALNIDSKDYYTDIHVEGLVSCKDNTAITDIMAATQHPTMFRRLHFGFQMVPLEPVSSASISSTKRKDCCIT